MSEKKSDLPSAANQDFITACEATLYILELLPNLRREAARRWRPGFLKGESASDLFQRTVTIALKEAGDFRGSTKAELYGWLKTILVNEIRQSLRKYRQKKRDVRLEEPFRASLHSVSNQETPSSVFAETERNQRLEDCLAKLSPEQQLVLALRLNEKLSHEEIGARIGKSAEAARKISQRAAVRLQQLYKSKET